MQASLPVRAGPPRADELVREAARLLSLVIPAQAGIQSGLPHMGERRREAYVSGFRLSPERRTERWLHAVPYPKD